MDRVQRRASSSAISPGRMRETDVIKGKDSTIPSEPGMYRHRNKQTGEIEYIGQTNNLRKRQQEHAREGRYDPRTQYVQYGIAKSGSTKDDLLQTEKNHISRHKPKGNTTAGGNGRR